MSIRQFLLAVLTCYRMRMSTFQPIMPTIGSRKSSNFPRCFMLLVSNMTCTTQGDYVYWYLDL